MHPWLILLTLFQFILTPFSAPGAAFAVILNDVLAQPSLGKQVLIQASYKSESPLKEIYLFIQPQASDTHVEQLPLSPEGKIDYRLDLIQLPLRPFASVNYWFQFVSTSGAEFTSPTYAFDYSDDRFQWQTLEDSSFILHWYEGNISFGQTALNVAQAGVKNVQGILPTALPVPLKIYIYAHSVDLQSALQLTNQNWVAGHASPDLGTVLVTIPQGPEQRLELERQLPHELMHIALYQTTGSGYQNLPLWLMEGMASQAELYPNPDYQQVLKQAAQQNALLPFNSICKVFPREASGAFQAYAQSASFVRFLEKKFGATGLQDLLMKYQDGLGCAEGVQSAFGVSLDQLQTEWQQQSLGMNLERLAIRNLAPFLLIFAVVLIPPLFFGVRWLFSKKPSSGGSR